MPYPEPFTENDSVPISPTYSTDAPPRLHFTSFLPTKNQHHASLMAPHLIFYPSQRCPPGLNGPQHYQLPLMLTSPYHYHAIKLNLHLHDISFIIKIIYDYISRHLRPLIMSASHLCVTKRDALTVHRPFRVSSTHRYYTVHVFLFHVRPTLLAYTSQFERASIAARLDSHTIFYICVWNHPNLLHICTERA